MSVMQMCAAVAVVLLAGVGPANANVTYSSVAYDTAPAPDQMMVVDFDHPAATGYSMTWTNTGLFQGPLVPGIAAPPVGDSTNILRYSPVEPLR
jgi:hypothetical protein